MKVYSLEAARQRDREGLLAYLSHCREMARSCGHDQIASISLAVREMDPLAVWEAIYDEREPVFYLEQPAENRAMVALGAVVSHQASGPGRFVELADWSREWLENTIVIGDWELPGAGPHFAAGFTFEEDLPPYHRFRPGYGFLPRYQLSRCGDHCSAVANLMVGPETVIEELAQRILAAHHKFYAFDYLSAMEGRTAPAVVRRTDLGGEEEVQAVFESGVERALQEIASGDLRKVVLARTQDIAADQPFFPPYLLDRMRKRFPGCHTFALGLPGAGTFLGATPERLVRLSEGVVATEAIAGTAPRSESPREDAMLGEKLLASDKDRREHRVVVESILAAIQQLGGEPDPIPEPRLLRLPNVQHLWVPLRVRVGEDSVLRWVAALQPTPAVGGIPRARALQRIKEWESQPRGLYAGSVGWWDHTGSGDFLVGIRSALVQGEHARLWAGAGIVEGSVPAREYQETTDKLAALKDVLTRPFAG